MPLNVTLHERENIGECENCENDKATVQVSKNGEARLQLCWFCAGALGYDLQNT